MLSPQPVCPSWSNDVAEHELPALDAAVCKVWRDACALVKAEKPTRHSVCRWHKRSFRDVAPVPYYAGFFRQLDVSRPCLATEVLVPQPDGDPLQGVPFIAVTPAMLAFERDLHDQLESLESAWPTLTDEERLKRSAYVVGVAVATLVRIHPFINGNGRMSRMLWGVLLARIGLPVPMAVVKRPGPPYPDVMAAAMRGDPIPAVALVLGGIALMKPPASTVATSP